MQNAKVVQIGLGKFGAINAAKTGGILTIYLVTTFRVIDYFLRDSMTLNQLIGTLSTDFIKVGISTAAAIGAATLTASAVGVAVLGSFAIGPLVAAIAIGVVTTVALEWVDQKYNITNKVVDGLDALQENAEYKIVQLKNKVVDLGKKAIESATDEVVEFAADELQKYVINAIHELIWVRPQTR